MRAFIAIDLPKEIKDKLEKIQERLKRIPARINWVKPQNIHLTLRFLGEINQDMPDKIIAAIEDTISLEISFQVSLSSISIFPDLGSPRVIWIGVTSGEKETRGIYLHLEEKLKKLGIPRETRQFSAHITLGRIKSVFNRQELTQDLNNSTTIADNENSQFWVRKITLFKSTLTTKGPIYEIIKEVSLKSSEN